MKDNARQLAVEIWDLPLDPPNLKLIAQCSNDESKAVKQWLVNNSAEIIRKYQSPREKMFFFCVIVIFLVSIYGAWHSWWLFKKPIERGCVRIEFSHDQQHWTGEISDAEFLRLHNTCNGMAVRMTEGGFGFTGKPPEVEQH